MFSILEIKSSSKLSCGCTSFDLNSNINKKLSKCIFLIGFQFQLDFRRKTFTFFPFCYSCTLTYTKKVDILNIRRHNLAVLVLT